jgi:hypothetical protein
MFMYRFPGIAVNTEAVLHHAVSASASTCANCEAAVAGHFCHQCGQETELHPPSTREFLHEFIGHYVALEGKLWKSLGLLLFRPGRLTLEYIKGRRVRYVQPLRLYLTFSLIFFAVMKYNGHDDKVAEAKAGPRHPVAASAGDARPAQKADQDDEVGLVHEDRPGEMRDGTEWLRTALGRYSPRLAAVVGDKVEHFGHLSREDQGKVLTTAFYSYVPYAIFFMMPLFALYLKVLYLGSGRRYGEHLLFALHTNGFGFLAMTLMMLVPQGFGWLEWLLGLWLTLYLPTAMRRVYGGSRTLTALRWIVLMLLHLVTIFVAGLAAVAFGVLH